MNSFHTEDRIKFIAMIPRNINILYAYHRLIIIFTLSPTHDRITHLGNSCRVRGTRHPIWERRWHRFVSIPRSPDHTLCIHGYVLVSHPLTHRCCTVPNCDCDALISSLIYVVSQLCVVCFLVLVPVRTESCTALIRVSSSPRNGTAMKCKGSEPQSHLLLLRSLVSASFSAVVKSYVVVHCHSASPCNSYSTTTTIGTECELVVCSLV